MENGVPKHPALSFILPTYNERENIRILIPQIAETFRSIPHEIIVVDDSSPDGTGGEVLALQKRYQQLRLLSRPEKTGIGSALRSGYEHARGEVILSSDTDLSFQPADLMKLYLAIQNGFDLVIGSRHSVASRYETPSLKIWLKYLVSRWGNALLKIIFRMPVRDFSVNCRAIRKSTWEALYTRENTNFFLFEMIFLAKKFGARITEVPVTFLDRGHGRTKINHFVEIPKALVKMLLFLLRR